MASDGNQIPFIFLIVLCFSLHIQARESRFFFSKITHKNNVIETTIPELEAPILAPVLPPVSAPAPTPIEFLSENNYELYDRASSEFPTKTATTNENEVLSEEFENQNYREYETRNANNNYYNYEYPKGNYHNNNKKNNFNNNGDGYYKSQYQLSGNYNNDENTNNYNRDGYTSKYNSNNGYSANNYNNNEFEAEKQGMSDTRFLNNGRYFVDVKGEQNNNANKYESGKVYPNEFNTMEEYYQSQQEYQQNQEQYEP